MRLPRQRPAGFLAGTRGPEPAIVRDVRFFEPVGVLGPTSVPAGQQRAVAAASPRAPRARERDTGRGLAGGISVSSLPARQGWRKRAGTNGHRAPTRAPLRSMEGTCGQPEGHTFWKAPSPLWWRHWPGFEALAFHKRTSVTLTTYGSRASPPADASGSESQEVVSPRPGLVEVPVRLQTRKGTAGAQRRAQRAVGHAQPVGSPHLVASQPRPQPLYRFRGEREGPPLSPP